MQSLMKQKSHKKLVHQSVAIALGLAIGFAILAAVFILSAAYMNSLEGELLPLLDSCEQAARSGELERVNSIALEILELLDRSQVKLQLFANHYDIEKCMNAARLLALLGEKGDIPAYLNSIVEIRSQVLFIKENNRLSLGIII